ncbi:MAG: hypothetical protein ACOH1N_14840 [Lutibacter sp.]
MAVLLYQIGIFVAIQIAAMFGKKTRNTALVLISIFTILQVFMSWLLLLQFITIFISYMVSNKIFFDEEESQQEGEPRKVVIKSYENGARVYREYDENDDLSPEIRKRVENKKEIDRITKASYENDPEYKKAVDDVMSNMFKNVNKK